MKIEKFDEMGWLEIEKDYESDYIWLYQDAGEYNPIDLWDVLRAFEDKKVRITIEEV